MASRAKAARSAIVHLAWLAAATAALGKSARPAAPALRSTEAQVLVERALAAELRTAQDASHPMRYVLRKTSPQLSTTKEIVETKDGAVARLLAMNGEPLSPFAEQQEQARLEALLNDPGRQRHRKQGEDQDTARALKVLRALPQAFVYTFQGSSRGAGGTVARFSFRPNRNFIPQDIETQALTVMSGEIWVNVAEERVMHLKGYLEQDVTFGWGILGWLAKGGWVEIEQADVGGGQWRVVHFKMGMNGRVLFRNKVFDTEEEEGGFAPVPVNLSYRQAIEMLRLSGQNGMRAKGE